MKNITLLGLKVTSATVGELHREISRIISSDKQGYVLSANIYGFNLACKKKWLADFYNQADLVHCDGAGIMLGARIFGHRIPERITYADWGWLLANYCAAKGHSLYLLGGPEGLAEDAASKLIEHTPHLKIAGAYHGYFNKEGYENEDVIQAINRVKPDIMLVGMGMGLQERWIIQNHSAINVKVFMVCGAAFRYWAGWTGRCPQWMGNIGFEWLYRFFQEPNRMYKRYLWGNTIFLINIFLNRFGLKNTGKNRTMKV